MKKKRSWAIFSQRSEEKKKREREREREMCVRLPEVEKYISIKEEEWLMIIYISKCNSVLCGCF